MIITFQKIMCRFYLSRLVLRSPNTILLLITFILILFPQQGRTQFQSLRCNDIFKNQSSQSLALKSRSQISNELSEFDPSLVITKRNSRIQFNDIETLKIIRSINLVFSEFPRVYIESTPQWTQIVIPQSRWSEIFKLDFEEVVQNLKESPIYKTDTYSDGSKLQQYETKLLLASDSNQTRSFPNEWEPIQQVYVLRIDPRLLELMKRHPEPSHVATILELGSLQTLYQKDGKWVQWLNRY